ANFQLYLGGSISSTDSLVTTADLSAMLIREGGGYRTSVYGANANYQGNWLLKTDFVDTNNTTITVGNNATTHTDARFGSGTIYIQGGGIQGGGHVYNDITIQTGNTGSFRNNDFNFYGTVSVDGTLRTTSANSDELVIRGTLQGAGTIRNAKVTLANGGVLDPGRVGVTYYTESSHTYVPQADDLTGTLTLHGGLDISSGGMINFDILGGADYDKVVLRESSVTYGASPNTTTLNFSDDVDLTNATLQLSFGGDFDWETPSMSLLLIDTQGTVTGLESATVQYVLAPGAAAVGTLPDYMAAALSVTSDGVTLSLRAIPEPSSLMLLILGVTGVCWRRRRAVGPPAGRRQSGFPRGRHLV
ncbi:MAG: PEP-CTERM sorting domain-containing protein, partial [Patescibacteria group bacterium]|nr:PEP-CTERM sorting domain-containing protein [Patescibacteria group bacterium]